MAGNDKVLINLTTGLEDSERVTVALLVATAGLKSGKQVARRCSATDPTGGDLRARERRDDPQPLL